VQNGYHLTIQADNDTLAFAVDGKDAVLVSSSIVSSRKIRTEIPNMDVPLISWEMTLFDDFGWTGRKKNTDYGRTLESALKLVNKNHPIAQGLEEIVSLFDVHTDVTWGWPNENADVIAVLASDTTKAAVFTYGTGSKMNKELTAKARQVGFCFTDDSPVAISDAGWQLFFSALSWAMAGERLQAAQTPVSVPATHQLYQNYPNPFNPSTQIPFDLSEPAHVSVEIYNARGQRVKTLIDQRQAAGAYLVEWDGRNKANVPASAGLYFYRLKVGDSFQQMRKMVLLK